MLPAAFVFLSLVFGDANAFHLLHHHLRHRHPITSPAPLTVLHNARRAVDGTGLPSARGWKSGRLDKLTEWTVAEEPNRPIICEYQPNALWLWTRWAGTVLCLTARTVIMALTMGVAVDIWARSVSKVSWPLLAVPPATEPVIVGLEGFRKMWAYQLTLSTFILAFFTSQAYGYWMKVYNTARAIQGRINDICLLLTIGAQRGTDKTKGTTGYSEKAAYLVKLCTRLIRVSHTFFWAATPTVSNGLSDSAQFVKASENCPLPIDDQHIGPLLLSPFGLKALVDAGQLTKAEVKGLKESGLPPQEYAYALIVWVGLYAMNGISDGILRGGNGFEENLLRQLTTLRGEYFNVDDFRAGRMPLAYVQLMQVLVDTLVVLAPFALYPELGSLSIPMTGLLTLFFKGLLELSKSFLDPFGVEGNTGQNIRVDVLVSELNFGASSRWVKAGAVLPINALAS